MSPLIDDSLFQELIADIRTVQDMADYTARLNEVIAACHRRPRRIWNTLNELFPYGERQVLVRAIETQAIPADDAVLCLNFFQEIRDRVIQLPVIGVEVAIPLSAKSVIRLSEWLRQKAGVWGVVDIVITPEILGGARIGYQGVIHDYSLLNQCRTHEDLFSFT